MGIAHGTGIGIGLFLLLILLTVWVWLSKTRLKACQWRSCVYLLPGDDELAGAGGHLRLEKCRVPGGILLVIIAISIIA